MEYPQTTESIQFTKPRIPGKANSSPSQINEQPDIQSSNPLVIHPGNDFRDDTTTSTKQENKTAINGIISVPHGIHHGSRYLVESESRKVQQELDELEKRLMASKERFSQTDSVTDLLTSPYELDEERNSHKQDKNPQDPSVNILQQFSSTAIIQNNTSTAYDEVQPSFTVQYDHQSKTDVQHRFDNQQTEINQLKEEKEYWITNQLQSQQQMQELTQQLEKEKEIQLELGKQNFLLKEKIIQLEKNLQRHLQGTQDRQQQDLQVDKIREDWQLMKKNKVFYEDQIQQLVRENTILQTKLDDFNVVKQELITIQQDFKAAVTEKMASLQSENDQLREALYEVESLRHEGIQFKVKLDQILQENDQLHQRLDRAEQMQSPVPQMNDELRDRLEIENGQIHQTKQLTIDDQNHDDNHAEDGQQSPVTTHISPHLNPSTRLPFDTSSPSHKDDGNSLNIMAPNNNLSQTLDADLSTLSKESTKLQEIETRLNDLRRENKLLSGSLRDTEVVLHSLTTSFNADDHPNNRATSSPPTTASASITKLELLEQRDPALSLSISATKVKENQVNSEEGKDKHTREATSEALPSHHHLNPFLTTGIDDRSHHDNHNDTRKADIIENGTTANDKGNERETSTEFIPSQNRNPFLRTSQNNGLTTTTEPSLVSKSRLNYDSGAFSATFADGRHPQFDSNGHIGNNGYMNKDNERHLSRSGDRSNEYNNQDLATIGPQVNTNFPSSVILDRDYRLAQISGNDQQPTKQKATIVTATTTTSSGSYDREDTFKPPFRMEIKVQQEKSKGDLHGGSYTSSFNNENISSRVSVFSEDSYMEFAATTRNQAKASHAMVNRSRYPLSSQHQSRGQDENDGNHRTINSPFKYDLSMLVHDQS